MIGSREFLFPSKSGAIVVVWAGQSAMNPVACLTLGVGRSSTITDDVSLYR